MSANLDKSLDDLVGSRRQTARRRGAGRRAAAKPSVGGVKKASKTTKATAKVVHPTPTAPAASSKIIVSGLVSNLDLLPLVSFNAVINIVDSLPMCLRPISRYVKLQAYALALIAIFVSSTRGAQHIESRSRTLPPLHMLQPGRLDVPGPDADAPPVLFCDPQYTGWQSRRWGLSSVLVLWGIVPRLCACLLRSR